MTRPDLCNNAWTKLYFWMVSFLGKLKNRPLPRLLKGHLTKRKTRSPRAIRMAARCLRISLKPFTDRLVPESVWLGADQPYSTKLLNTASAGSR